MLDDEAVFCSTLHAKDHKAIFPVFLENIEVIYIAPTLTADAINENTFLVGREGKSFFSSLFKKT